MQHVFVNWQTSLVGAIVIGLGVFQSVTGLHIPGFSMDTGAAIATGVGLLLAKDGAS